MAHDVYISYSAKDKTTADAVCRTLESEKISCWMNRDTLPDMFRDQVVFEAIDRARDVVLVLSAAANDSPQVHREVEHAVSHGIPILPLRIENVQFGPELKNFIGNVQWQDALTRPLEPHLRRLADTIKMRLKPKEVPSRTKGVGAAEPSYPASPFVPAPLPSSDWESQEMRALDEIFHRNAPTLSLPPRPPRTPSAPPPPVPAAQPAPPVPAPPPPLNAGAPPLAPSPSAPPESRSSSSLFRGLTRLMRPRASTPPAPVPQRPETPHASRPVVNQSLSSRPGQPRETPQARVDFSVYAPSSVQPGSSFLLNVWACVPGQRAEMVDRATGPSRKVEAGSRGGILLPSETPLFLRLLLNGFAVDNPLEPFAWHGQVTNVGFLVSAPSQLAPGAYPGQVQLLDGGMLIGKFYFEVVVAVEQAAGATAPAKQAELRSEWMRSAFASYASPDREKVVQRVQGITAAGVNVYLDVASLRTGHEWEKQLFDAIESADVFYLFWSSFARASKNVEREWRTALDKKGLAFIHPIPLEDPRLALPPDELRSLHFNDIYLAILKTSTPGDSPAGGPS